MMPFVSAFLLPWLEPQAVAEFTLDAFWVWCERERVCVCACVCKCVKASARQIELGAALAPLAETFPPHSASGR